MITVHIIYMIILESFLPGSEPPFFTKLYDFCILDMQLCLLSNSMKQVVLWLLSLWSSDCEFKLRFNPCGLVITQHTVICVKCEATSWFLHLSSILSKQDNDVFNVCGFKEQSRIVMYRYTGMHDVSYPLSVLLPSPSSLFSKPSAHGSSCMSLVLFKFSLLKRSFSLVIASRYKWISYIEPMLQSCKVSSSFSLKMGPFVPQVHPWSSSCWNVGQSRFCILLKDAD